MLDLDWPDMLFGPVHLYTMPKLYKHVDTQQFVPGEVNFNVGTKFDQDKLRMDLIDAKAMEGLASVLTFGAKKYAAHNWRNGIHYSRIMAALLRHVSAIQRGEYIDPESGLPHIDHVGCCWMFLSNFMKTRPDLDDLWKPNENKESNSR